MIRWRVGRKLGRTLYLDDKVVGMVDTPELAESIVRAMNEATPHPEHVFPCHDGGHTVRPHTIPGWWQVWSGSLCIALLSDDDVAPINRADR